MPDNKVPVALALAGLAVASIAALISGCGSGVASSEAYDPATIKGMTQVAVVEKNGTTCTIVGRKDTAQTIPEYDPSNREWIGDPQDWSQIEQTVTDAFQTEYDANLAENQDRITEFEKQLELFYSASSGELQKRQAKIEHSRQCPARDCVSEIAVDRMEFRGISVQDEQATCIVDVWTRMQGLPADSPDNAKQHNLALQREHGRWLIAQDVLIPIPGSYEPRV